jgi:hypothetical protein
MMSIPVPQAQEDSSSAFTLRQRDLDRDAHDGASCRSATRPSTGRATRRMGMSSLIAQGSIRQLCRRCIWKGLGGQVFRRPPV